MKRVFLVSSFCIALGSLTFLTGCRIAPLQVIAQPREVRPAPETPKVPEPDAAAAEVPAGYQVEIVAKGLTYPSSVEFDGQGNMFVAEAGYVYGDEAAPTRILKFDKGGNLQVIADQLHGPITDLLWHQNQLYISHKGTISVWDGKSLRDIVTELPSKGDHHNNQLVAGPDGKIYLGQGTASNSGIVGIDNFVFGWLREYPEFHDVSPYAVQLRGENFASINPLMLSSKGEKKLVRTGAFQPLGSTKEKSIPGNPKANGAVLRFNSDGSGLEVFAWGLRNPFGLAWSADGKLYASENGFDSRGSRPIANAPDCLWEIRQNAWYGWPDYAAGIPVTDKRFRPTNGPEPKFLLASHPKVEKPLATVTPHSALTKVDFSRSERFGFAGQMFVGAAGDMEPITGNDPRPVGFEVLRVDVKSGETVKFFAAKRDTLGKEYLEYVTTPGPKRPVDVRFSPEDDSLYVVDIGAILLYPTVTPMPHPYPGSGVIWRISREGTAPKLQRMISLLPGTTIQEKAGASREPTK